MISQVREPQVGIEICLPGWVLVAIVALASAPRLLREIAGLVVSIRRR